MRLCSVSCLAVLLLVALGGCAQPVRPAWPGVSEGAMPPVAGPPGVSTMGEQTPVDHHLAAHADQGGHFSSSTPPSYDSYEDPYAVPAGKGPSAPIDPVYDAAGEQVGGVGDPTDPVEDWIAQEGVTLKQLLTDWTDRSGWRLIWRSSRDYKLAAGAMFRGRFTDVTSAIVRSFARARPAPIATFYKGNRVILLETLEDENAY